MFGFEGLINLGGQRGGGGKRYILPIYLATSSTSISIKNIKYKLTPKDRGFY